MNGTLISGDYFDLGFDPATAFPDDYAEAQVDIYDQASPAFVGNPGFAQAPQATGLGSIFNGAFGAFGKGLLGGLGGGAGVLGAAGPLAGAAGRMMSGNLREGAFEALGSSIIGSTIGMSRGFAASNAGEDAGAARRLRAIRNAQFAGQSKLARIGNAQRFKTALAGTTPGYMHLANMASKQIYGV